MGFSILELVLLVGSVSPRFTITPVLERFPPSFCELVVDKRLTFRFVRLHGFQEGSVSNGGTCVSCNYQE
jgi:hypothetical protein